MMTQTLNRFDPDYIVLPGTILEETLEARGIKKQDFALRCDVSPKTVSQIIGGDAPVSPELAIRFERVLGVSASVWNNLEGFYRLFQARAAEWEKLQGELEWAKRFPLKELRERGFIPDSKPKVETVVALLEFFSVSSVEAWRAKFSELKVAFRQSPAFKCSPESVSAWLRIGELKAAEVETEPYDKERFKEALAEIRELTRTGPDVFEDRMTGLCAGAGVALTFVSELPKTRLYGATRWLASDKALIILSLRQKTDDHFWFTFFHEAGHILLHGKKQGFIDEPNQKIDNEEEEANQFAANHLIPKNPFNKFVERGSFTAAAIRAFAAEAQVSPGVVVGRLQHDKIINHWDHNPLKKKLRIVEPNGTE